MVVRDLYEKSIHLGIETASHETLKVLSLVVFLIYDKGDFGVNYE